MKCTSRSRPRDLRGNITDLPNDAVTANSSEEAKPVELTPEEKAEKAFITAQKYKKDRQFVKALEEYQKIPAITNDTATVARSYEEIATIYFKKKIAQQGYDIKLYDLNGKEI